MRRVSLLLGLAACGTPEPADLEARLAAAVDLPLDAPGEGLRAPPARAVPLTLRVDPTVRGQDVAIAVRGAPPGATVYLGGSATGPGLGPCPPLLDGLCLDLLAPVLVDQATADASGAVDWTFRVPASGPLDAIALQAAVGAPDGADKSLPVLRELTAPPVPGCYTVTPQPGPADPSRLVVEPQRYDPTARFEAARLLMRPITLAGGGGGPLDLRLTGGHQLFDPAGTPLGSALTVDDADLPMTLLVSGASGRGALALEPAGACPTQRLPIHGEPRGGLIGRPLSAAPGFQVTRLSPQDAPLSTILDGRRFPDRVGALAEVHLVPDRDLDAWILDPTIAPVATTAASVGDGPVPDAVETLVNDPPDPTRLTDAYDVVIDFDGNGRLDPGDWIDGLDGPAVTVFGDLSAAGPYGHHEEDRDFGTYREQRIYEPATDPPFPAPVVLISHGNGHDYRWYDYLGRHLASYGYVVMSHRNNTGPGTQSSAVSIRDNLDLFLGQLGVYFPTEGGLPPVDPHSILNIGHSRGGEGAVIAYDDVFDDPTLVSNYTLDDIRLISSIAPPIYYLGVHADPHDVNYHLLAGGSDGDVSASPAVDSRQYFQLPAYALGRVQTTYVHGASHNDFQEDGTWDDGVGPARIGRTEGLKVSRSYYLALAEWYLRGETAFEELFTRGYDDLHPDAFGPGTEVAQVWIPVERDGAQLLDDLQTEPGLDVSASGGDVFGTVTERFEGILDDPDGDFSWTPGEYMNGMTEVNVDGFERGAHLAWDGHAHLQLEVPAGQRDLTGFDAFVLRAAQVTQNPTNTEDKSFAISLVDATGRVATVRPGWRDELTETYERSGGWTNEFNTVQVRLTDFLLGGTQLDLADVAYVRLEFGPSFGSAAGRIVVDDLFFVQEGVTPD